MPDSLVEVTYNHRTLERSSAHYVHSNYIFWKKFLAMAMVCLSQWLLAMVGSSWSELFFVWDA